MPFKIIRNDITEVHADIIVNTANPHPVCCGGTDQAIYTAAGHDELLTERKKIGDIARGEIGVTAAFSLHAQYIIHAVGPVWEGGEKGEFDLLESCYTKSLHKAINLNCKSIAFPLISTGVYGFPKDKALQIAVSVFSSFLLENEIEIILVVFDQTSFQLSEKIVGEINSYIDENYVWEKRKNEYNGRRTRCITKGLSEEDYCDEELIQQEPLRYIEDELNNIGMSFHEKLFELINKAGIDNKDVWKLANLDRKHFSKIQCDPKYHPKKKTVMALCIALKLDMDEAKDLMARADWAFSPSSKVDLIVQKAIIDKQYDIMQLNMVLFKYTNEILGV